MARIMILPEKPKGIRRLLAWNARRQYGFLPGVFRILGVDLTIGMTAGKLYHYLHLRKSSPLTRLQREMIATVVNGLIGGAA